MFFLITTYWMLVISLGYGRIPFRCLNEIIFPERSRWHAHKYVAAPHGVKALIISHRSHSLLTWHQLLSWLLVLILSPHLFSNLSLLKQLLLPCQGRIWVLSTFLPSFSCLNDQVSVIVQLDIYWDFGRGYRGVWSVQGDALAWPLIDFFTLV